MLICLHLYAQSCYTGLAMYEQLNALDLAPNYYRLVRIAVVDISLLHADKEYHNLDFHTLRVIDWTNRLAKYEGYGNTDRCLLVAAAAYHDYIHGGNYGQDEAESAEVMVGNMRLIGGFSVRNMEDSRKFVRGTTIRKIGERLVQEASFSDDNRERTLADADLWTLGASEEELITANVNLLKERCPGADLRGIEMYEMLGVTLQLLEDEPLTAGGRALLPNRRSNHAGISEYRRALGRDLGLAA